jgi:hypothetical protein
VSLVINVLVHIVATSIQVWVGSRISAMSMKCMIKCCGCGHLTLARATGLKTERDHSIARTESTPPILERAPFIAGTELELTLGRNGNLRTRFHSHLDLAEGDRSAAHPSSILGQTGLLIRCQLVLVL